MVSLEEMGKVRILDHGLWNNANDALPSSKVKDLFGGFRHSLETGFKNAIDRGIISPTISPFGLASAITGLIDGIGLQMVAEPDLIDNEEIWKAVKESVLTLLNGS